MKKSDTRTTFSPKTGKTQNGDITCFSLFTKLAFFSCGLCPMPLKK